LGQCWAQVDAEHSAGKAATARNRTCGDAGATAQVEHRVRGVDLHGLE
jgi:hypothetical protein